jgi:DNA-binding NarL/FixJ family response regulator
VIGIVIAVEQPMVRAGVRTSLERDTGFSILGEAKSARTLHETVRRTAPRVVLLDEQMRGVDALAYLDQLHDEERTPAVVLLSDDSDPQHIQAAFSRGAVGYVLKRIDPADLPGAIRQAIDGTAFHASGLPGLNDESAARAAGLTDRELAVIKAVARGLSNSAVGKELWVTEQTVKFHLTNVYRKIGVNNRTAAVRWAVTRGLV